MASSGLLSTSNQYVKYWIEVIQEWQDIANNISRVTVNVWAKRTNTGYTTWGTGSVTLKVNGTYYNSGNKDISIGNNNVLVHCWTGNITHETDGSKTLVCSAALNMNSLFSSSEQAYNEYLTTIPRTSSFSINKNTCELGTPFTVTINRASSAFTHAVSYIIGGGSERRYLQQWDATSTTCSTTPPITDAVYTNSDAMGITVVVDTYLGSNLVGSTTKTITLTVPSNIVPQISSVTATLTDGAWSKYIKGKSKVKLTANGVAGVYGSRITSLTFEGGGYSNTDTTAPWEYTTGTLNTAGNNVFTATVTDSRGRTNTATVTIAVTDYYSPCFTEAWCVRCLQNGTIDLNGTYAKILINFNYDKVGGSNTHIVKYRYRIVGGTWSPYVNITNNVITAPLSGFSTDLTYEIELCGADYFTNITPKIVILQTAVFPIDMLKGNKGIAFGKAAELEGIAEFAYQAKFNKSIICKSEGTGTTADELFAMLQNNGAKNKVGLASGAGGIGLRINNYNNSGAKLGYVDILPTDIIINGTSIVESGGDVYNRYVRYADGTQICYGTNYAWFNINANYGSVCYSQTKCKNTFARTFIEQPRGMYHGVFGNGGWVMTDAISTTGMSGYVYNAIAVNIDVACNYIVIGRWK